MSRASTQDGRIEAHWGRTLRQGAPADRQLRALGFTVCAATACACGDYEEAPRVEVPLVADSSGIATVVTDLGYEVELQEARAMVQNVSFAIAGEAHAQLGTRQAPRGKALWQRALDFVVPPAYAHPGHFQEGDITGELLGRFQLTWLSSTTREVGIATLIVGSYQSANLTFAYGTEADGMAAEDPLLEHTALLRGQARREEAVFEFVATVDSPEGRQLVGAPFEHTITQEEGQSLGLRLLTRDPYEGDTLFDGIDFAALDSDADGSVQIGAASSGRALDAYFQLRRTFQTHDHFDVQVTSVNSQPFRGGGTSP